MKAMLTAFAAIIVISIAADFLLDSAGYSSARRNVSQDVRLGDL